jgi:hypothetical protein
MIFWVSSNLGAGVERFSSSVVLEVCRFSQKRGEKETFQNLFSSPRLIWINSAPEKFN